MKINSNKEEELEDKVETAIKKLEKDAEDSEADTAKSIAKKCDILRNKVSLCLHNFNKADDLIINNIIELLPILENIKILDDRALAFIHSFSLIFPSKVRPIKEGMEKYEDINEEYEKYSSLLKKYLLTELLGTNSGCIFLYNGKINYNHSKSILTVLKLERLLLIQSYIVDRNNIGIIQLIFNKDSKTYKEIKTSGDEVLDDKKLIKFYADDIKKEIEGTEQLMKEFINLQSNEKNYEEHKKNQLSQKVKEEFRSSATKSAIVALSASGIALGSAGTAALLDEKIADKILRQLKEKIGLKSVSPQTLAICLIALGIMFLGIAGTVALATEQKRQNDGKKDIPPHTN